LSDTASSVFPNARAISTTWFPACIRCPRSLSREGAQVALSLAGIGDGMRVLEVATGSGEMFGRIVASTPAA